MSQNRRNLPTIDDCNGCGVCCFHMGYPSYVTGSETQPAEPHWVSLPEDLRVELEEYVATYQPPKDGELDGVCFWLDPKTRLCKHHEYRPNVCRDFPVGGSGCRGWRDHYRDQIQTKR